MKQLRVPLSYADVAALHVGDILTISGAIWTCRSGFYHKYIEEGCSFPLDKAQHNVVLHSGPIIKREGEDSYKLQAISITTSVRFNKWEPQAIEELGLRAIIAKGRVGKETREAMQKFGCVHLSRTGTFAGAFALNVRRIQEAHWLDLGLPEALWLFEFEDFGPLVVETDIYGHSWYDHVSHDFETNLPSFYEKLGIDGFDYNEK